MRVVPAETDAAALAVFTGHTSALASFQAVRCASQEVFDEQWVAGMGDDVTPRGARVADAARHRLRTVRSTASVRGNRTNTNGYRVLELVEAPDAVTVRLEDISFQTASLDGEDHGVPTRPWALILVPRTARTIFIEDNAQRLKNGTVQWTRRAAFPGHIGIGRTVPGTRQTESR